MNGIICINKPKGFTSFDVIAKLRGIMKIRKMGHAGTLDPMATGVLPVFVGNATRACDIMPDSTKRYTATFRLGCTTDTLDITGEVLTECKSNIDRNTLENVLEDFRGDIMQIPPMYSAVSINGKRLYDLARKGETVERPPRSITINSLELIEFDEATQTGVIDVDCSKGTYIRSLVSDIGEKLGCGGVLTELVRTRAGIFTLDKAVTIEQMQQIANSDGDFTKLLLLVEAVFESLPEIRLNEFQTRLFLNGVKLDLKRVKYKKADESHRVYSAEGKFLGLATTESETQQLRIAKMFYERA